VRDQRWDVKRIERCELQYLLADQDPAGAADGDHEMDVAVLLEARVAAGLELEVAQLEVRGDRGGAREREARDRPPSHSALAARAELVCLLVDSRPPERFGIKGDSARAVGWVRFGHGGGGALHRVAGGAGVHVRDVLRHRLWEVGRPHRQEGRQLPDGCGG